MRRVITAGETVELLDGSSRKHSLISVESGEGLVYVGGAGAEAYPFLSSSTGTRQFFVAAGMPAYVRANTPECILTVGDYGEKEFSGGGIPQFQPFTIVAGESGGEVGYSRPIPEEDWDGYGEIVGTPLDGYTVENITTYDDGESASFSFQIFGPIFLLNELVGATLRVNGEDLTVWGVDRLNASSTDSGQAMTVVSDSLDAPWQDGQTYVVEIIPAGQ